MKNLTKQIVGVTASALFLVGCQTEAQSNEGLAVKGTSQEGQVTRNESAFISLDEAKEIAFDHAEVDGKTAHFDEAVLDESDRVYELEFEVDETEFEYDIEAVTGEILKAERDEDDESGAKTKDSERLTLDEALTVALEHAGVDRGSVTVEENDWDEDDQIIELEFFTDDVEFDYDIHAITGKIMEAEQERRDSKGSDMTAEVAGSKDESSKTKNERGNETEQNTSSETKKKTENSPATIGLDKAKQIALEHAGESLSSVHFDDLELDKDDQQYEMEFSSSDTEYDYDIDAVSGEILSFDKEQETKTITTNEETEPGTPSKDSEEKQKAAVKSEPVLLTKEQAIDIALNHAGTSKNQVEFDDVERDDDDGRIIWEIEFESGAYEFEYDIDAENGNILDYDKEWDD